MIEVRKNSRELVVLRLDAVRGNDVADVRIWAVGDGTEWFPTPKGLTLNVQLLPQLADAVATLTAEARAKGILPDAPII